MSKTTGTILVTGATGTQGGATARALLNQGASVRCLVRDPQSGAGLRLAAAGAEIFVGDLEDPASIAAAVAGMRAVFSVQVPPAADRDSERRQVRTLISCAQAAGVEQFVQSSVASTGWRKISNAICKTKTNYWDSKEDVEQAVRESGFSSWSILKPAAIMENFLPPAADHMYPDLAKGEILVATEPEVELMMIAADDIGAVAAAAFAAPERFAGAEIDLIGDQLSYPHIAHIVSDALGRTIRYRHVAAEELLARGDAPGWVESQLWVNQIGSRGTPKASEHWGVRATSFADWTRDHADMLTTALQPSSFLQTRA